jgi:hypothetical protein
MGHLADFLKAPKVKIVHPVGVRLDGVLNRDRETYTLTPHMKLAVAAPVGLAWHGVVDGIAVARKPARVFVAARVKFVRLAQVKPGGVDMQVRSLIYVITVCILFFHFITV